MSGTGLPWERDDADGTTVWVGHSGAVPVASAWERPQAMGNRRWGWTLCVLAAERRGHEPDLDAARAAADAAWTEWCQRTGLVAADTHAEPDLRAVEPVPAPGEGACAAASLAAPHARALAAADFPRNTCPASRHVFDLAERLSNGRVSPVLEDQPEHCAASLFAVLAALWEARAALRGKGDAAGGAP